MRYEVTGDPLFKAIGTYFMDIINSSHCYATGGTSVGEFWSDLKRLATTLETENEESCTTYDMLKVSRNLFRWMKEMAYVDYYERALTNGVLSIQRGTEPGVMIYMLPLGRGQSKAHSYHGWGTQFDTFWCCYGTGIESFSKLGVSIYFEEDADVPGLYIIQYVSSSFNWKSGQIMLKQDVEPVISSDAQLRVSLSFSTKEGIDAEASALQKRLEGMKESREASDKGEARTLEALKETLAEVRLCSTLEALLLQKKNLYYGDSPEIHSEKVDKLKVLSESLANSTVKAEKRISDHRNQKEEALNFRLAKTNDVSEAEKELATQIAELDKKRDELEAELKKVNSSLTAARARLHNTKEEREQFDEASNQFLLHLKAKEDDLSRSVASGKVEADVVHIWINFLEDSWHSQSSYIEQKEKQTNHELKKYGNYFADLVTNHLSAYKEKLGTFLSCIRKSVDHLKKFNERAEMESSPDSDLSNQRKKLGEEYVEFEVKIITTFSVADNMKQQFYSQHGSNSRQDDPKVKELFDAIEQRKKGFECIERPTLEIETPSPKGEWPPEEKSHKGSNAIETIEMAQPDKEVSPKSASTWTVRQKWQHWSLNLGTPAKITCQETLETGSLMPSNRNRNPATPHQINSQNLLHPEEHPVI